MLTSMTGYGQASLEKDGVSYTLELRTVNSKYLKIILRLPDDVGFLEDEIEKQLKKSLFRGTLNYSLRIKNVSAKPTFEINTAYLDAYVEQIDKAAGSVNANIATNVSLVELLSLPSVLQVSEPDEALAQSTRLAVRELTEKALDALIEMRMVEGRAMAKDLEGNCHLMRDILENVKVKAPTVVIEYKDKLQKRVDELLKDAHLELDESILTREVAIFADRCDISEEIARLDSHLEQFLNLCQEGGVVGKRLDFLCQEMFRETNTMGSKASSAEISKCVVDLKCCIDRIKEQVQNVE